MSLDLSKNRYQFLPRIASSVIGLLLDSTIELPVGWLDVLLILLGGKKLLHWKIILLIALQSKLSIYLLVWITLRIIYAILLLFVSVLSDLFNNE